MASANWKDAEARDEALPAYEEVGDSSQSFPAPELESQEAPSGQSQQHQQHQQPQPSKQPQPPQPSAGPAPTTPNQGPTAAAPFNFPTAAPVAADLPAYTSSANPPSPASAPALLKPVAIPQLRPEAASPLLDGYATALLALGIPPASFRNFLSTLSAFLAARVSDQALSHAADVGRHVGRRFTDIPKRFGKETADHARTVGRGLRETAASGNYLGVAVGTVGAAVTLPLGTAFRMAGAAIALPFTAMGAVASKPKTPRERAVAYTAVANKDWFNARGLHAVLMDSGELARALDLPGAEALLQKAGKAGQNTAAAQMGALDDLLMPLELHPTQTLQLGPQTLWLVIVRAKGIDDGVSL